MFDVTPEWLESIRHSHQLYARLTAKPLKGEPVTLDVQSGSVNATYQRGTRRTAQLSVYALGHGQGVTFSASAVAALLKRTGTRCLLEADISTAQPDHRMIPMITGMVSNVSWRVGDGIIDLQLTDEWWRVAQGRFTVPWTPTAGLRRTTAVEQLMREVAPDREITDTASDAGTIQSQGDWGVDREQAIGTLCTDGGFDAYFDRDGRIRLEDSKSTNDPVVYSLLTGDGGTLESIETGLDVGRLYNTVVVKPSATDNSQKWSAQVASLTTGDRAPANLGVTIPYFIASPTISSAEAASQVAQNRLDYVTGTAETLQSNALGNLALDEGDVVEILIPGDDAQGTGATMWRYYVDSITWDLVTGDMTLKARNQGQVTDDAKQ
jgi:hypothetical protein